MMRRILQPSGGPEGERRYVVHVAARLLGVHPNYLHRLIRNLNLKPTLRKE